MTLIASFALPLRAQEGGDPYNLKPKGHETNKLLVATSYAANLKKHKDDTNILVLPGLVADKKKQRIEVTVESTGLGENESCEFTIIGENSDHAYEALLISFAKPSDVHQAIKFIGGRAGEPSDPGSFRFWSKGERYVLSLIREKQPAVRLEKALLDLRTGKTLPEEGFRFVGSQMVPSPNDPQQKVYAADVYQPVSVVSLFNSPYSVLEVPGQMTKEEAYQNTRVNPECLLPVGAMLSLVITPVDPGQAIRAKDLVLQVQAGTNPVAASVTGMRRLNALDFQLKDAAAVLNEKPTLNSVFETLGALDRKQFEYFLTVNFGADIELSSVTTLAKLLVIVDCERGIRIAPPAEGQLYYRAFLSNLDLLDREARIFHPWELALSETNGVVSGKLVRINASYKGDGSKAVLEATESLIASATELRAKFNADAEQARKGGQPASPPIIMVFAPHTLRYGQLIKFLEPVLSTHKLIHVYTETTMPPAVEKKVPGS